MVSSPVAKCPTAYSSVLVGPVGSMIHGQSKGREWTQLHDLQEVEKRQVKKMATLI